MCDIQGEKGAKGMWSENGGVRSCVGFGLSCLSRSEGIVLFEFSVISKVSEVVELL